VAGNSKKSKILENWKQGIDHFNAGRFWDAHEAWERGWLELPPEEKLHIQVLIQAAGVFYLVEKNRLSGAHSLLETALAKIQILRDAGGVEGIYPRVDIPGLEDMLRETLRTWPHLIQNSLKARLLLSPA
jgi:hypothetical protein